MSNKPLDYHAVTQSGVITVAVEALTALDDGDIEKARSLLWDIAYELRIDIKYHRFRENWRLRAQKPDNPG
jgi:hypothetical protein